MAETHEFPDKACFIQHENDGRFYSELLMKTSSTSKPMLLIPLVNKYEIDDYLYPSKINSSKISNCKHRAQIKDTNSSNKIIAKVVPQILKASCKQENINTKSPPKSISDHVTTVRPHTKTYLTLNKTTIGDPPIEVKSKCKQYKKIKTKNAKSKTTSHMPPLILKSSSKQNKVNFPSTKITSQIPHTVLKASYKHMKSSRKRQKISNISISPKQSINIHQPKSPVGDSNSVLPSNKPATKAKLFELKSICQKSESPQKCTKTTSNGSSPVSDPKTVSPFNKRVANISAGVSLNNLTSNIPPPIVSNSSSKQYKPITDCVTPSSFSLSLNNKVPFVFLKRCCNKSNLSSKNRYDQVSPNLTPVILQRNSPARDLNSNIYLNKTTSPDTIPSVPHPNCEQSDSTPINSKINKIFCPTDAVPLANSTFSSPAKISLAKESLNSSQLENNTTISTNFSDDNIFPVLPTDALSQASNTYSSSARTSNISLPKESLNTSQLQINTTITTKFSEISTNTTSDYVPDSTINMTDENNSTHTTLEEQEESIDGIENPLILNPVEVPYRSHALKKHFCLFCKTLQTKLSRHLYLKHKSEGLVKEALKFPPKSKERVKIVEELRKKGDFLHNTSEEYNSGILIVSRQQQVRCKNTVDDYVCCKYCKGFFSKHSLRIHLRKCGNKNKNARDNLISGRRITQYMHAAANITLKTKIFPVLRNDEVTKAIRYDELIIKYGNKLSEKYTLTHQHDMIRSQLRLLGRFIIEVKKLNTTVQELKDIYNPPIFDICIEALRKVANWDNSLMWFKTPAVAQHLTSLIKKCGCKQRSEFIKTQSEDLKKNLEDFLILWEEEIPVLINKKAFDDQCNQKRIKKVILPSKEDIKKLYLFLKNKILESIEVLQKKFNTNHWLELVKSALIFIQIFNRRRAGEIERLTIDNYLNKEIITEHIEKDLLEKMSSESVSFAKQFVRLTLRGKLGRTVSVLLSPLCTTAIDLIIKYREKAGISKNNEYIFSKRGASNLSKQYFRACPLLKQFSLECGAEIPESLRGTTLRKHIATYTSLLNIEEASVDQLANFMGHHKDIHKSIYRISVPVAEITCVSKLLMSAIGGEDEEEFEEVENEIESHEEIQDQNEQNNSSTSSNKKRRSTSPYGKTKRKKWSQEEKDAIFSVFGNLKELEKLPTAMECLNVIRNTPELKNRTPEQLKTWIDNQRRYK